MLHIHSFTLIGSAFQVLITPSVIEMYVACKYTVYNIPLYVALSGDKN